MIKKNTKRFRTEKSIRQDRLSKLSDLSPEAIVNMGSAGHGDPTIQTLNRIASAAGIKVNDLAK